MLEAELPDQKPSPGPIKGFSADRVLENLDAQVKEAWKGRMADAVFIHFLDGGYDQNIAHNVHVIADDLKSTSAHIKNKIKTPKLTT